MRACAFLFLLLVDIMVCIPYKQNGVAAAAQALQNVIGLVNLIKNTLITYDENSTSFSIFREFISK